MPLQIRRGTDAELQILTTAPVDGELIWTTDTRKLYIGDGTTLGQNLQPVTGYGDSDAVDATISAITAGTHSNISFDFTGGAISATVTLSDYEGVLKADGFTGSLFADDSGTLVNAVDGSINLNGTVKGHIIPDANETYDLGDSLHRFRDLWLSGTSIKLGGATINAIGSAVDLPGGSTIGGVTIGTPVGDLTGSVFGDDSTKLVDGVDNSLTTGDILLISNQIQTTGADLYISNQDDTLTARMVHLSVEGDAEWKVQGITGGATSGPGTIFETSRGTVAAPTALQVGDIMGSITAEGYDGTGVVTTSTIVQQIDPNGTVSVGDLPGRIALLNFQNGDAGQAYGMLINRNGYVTINKGLSHDAAAALDVEGGAIFTGDVTAAALKGTLVSDTSTVLIDGGTGGIFIANVDMIGETGNTPATPGTVDSWLEVTVNGATKYIPLYV